MLKQLRIIKEKHIWHLVCHYADDYRTFCDIKLYDETENYYMPTHKYYSTVSRESCNCAECLSKFDTYMILTELNKKTKR